jgi:hypothetical protein
LVSVTLFVLAFLCPLLGAGVGMALRRRLPEHHLSRDAIDVIKLAMGLMATLVALTLGLLISSANTYRGTIETEYKKILAGIVHLDEYLQAYGPETEEIRLRLRHVAARSFKERWPGQDFGPLGPKSEGGRHRYVEVQQKILELQPTALAQKWFQAEALQVTNHLANLRWLVVSQERASDPLLPVFIMIFLAAIAIFGGFSLYSPPNATVFSVLAVVALAIAGSIFLIVELNSPLHGLLELSSHGAHSLMQTLGQSLTEIRCQPCVTVSIFPPAVRPRHARASWPWRAKASGSACTPP